MKFNIERNELLSGISVVQKALSARTTNPLLEGIYLEASQSSLRLMCSDGTLQIDTLLPCAALEDGKVVLPGRLFCDIVRKLPEGTLDFSCDVSNLSVALRCGRSKMQLQGLSADEYPEMPSIQAPKEIVIKQGTLKEMIRQTSFATAQDEARPILTGVLVSAHEGILTLVALDGYRMAVRKESCNHIDDVNAVVHVASLNEISKAISDDDSDVTLSFSHSNARVDMGHTRINTALLNGEYMKYEQIMPSEHKTCIHVNRRELFESIERASLMARESKNNLVKMTISEDSMTVEANSEMGRVHDELTIAMTGNEIDIAFNARYMTDMLSKLTDETVMMRFNTSITPCIITPEQGNEYYYLVLPVRIFGK